MIVKQFEIGIFFEVRHQLSRIRVWHDYFYPFRIEKKASGKWISVAEYTRLRNELGNRNKYILTWDFSFQWIYKKNYSIFFFKQFHISDELFHTHICTILSTVDSEFYIRHRMWVITVYSRHIYFYTFLTISKILRFTQDIIKKCMS